MNKILIDRTALEIGNADPILGKEPKLVKVSFEDAANFESDFFTFEELLGKYGGPENRLQLCKPYDGYAIAYYNELRQNVVKINGYLKRVTRPLSVWLDLDILHAAKNGAYYEVVTASNYGETKGTFSKIWTFRNCHFTGWITKLQIGGHLDINIQPQDWDTKLKDKLVKGLITNSPVDISNEEFLILKTYLGEYYQEFFAEL